MVVEPSKELIELILSWNVVWRSGDVATAVASIASTDFIAMGGPMIGSLVLGRDQVAARVERVVTACGTQEGARVIMTDVVAWTTGDYGWSLGEGVLEAPGQPAQPVRQMISLVREPSGWKWVAWQLSHLR